MKAYIYISGYHRNRCTNYNNHSDQHILTYKERKKGLQSLTALTLSWIKKNCFFLELRIQELLLTIGVTNTNRCMLVNSLRIKAAVLTKGTPYMNSIFETRENSCFNCKAILCNTIKTQSYITQAPFLGFITIFPNYI